MRKRKRANLTNLLKEGDFFCFTDKKKTKSKRKFRNMTTTEILQRTGIINDGFSSRGLSQFKEQPAPRAPVLPPTEAEMEETYVLPGGISGNMKELLADPSQTTRSLRSAQAVMRSLYEITNVDDLSRRRMKQREVRNRMGIVLEIFKPKGSENETAAQVSQRGEATAKAMIRTAAVIYNSGKSDLGPIEIR